MFRKAPTPITIYTAGITLLCCVQSFVLWQGRGNSEPGVLCSSSVPTAPISRPDNNSQRLRESDQIRTSVAQRARLESPADYSSTAVAHSDSDPGPDVPESTQEEMMGKSAYEDFQKKEIAKYRALQKLDAERTLYYLSDALGLQLSKQQKEMGLDLLSNSEDSQDIVSDKEVSFLSNKLELSGEQKTLLRDSISKLQTASDEEVAALVPQWNGGIPAEFHDLEGEVDTLRLRNEALSHLLSPSLNPKQQKDLEEIRTLEAVQ